MQTTVNKIIPHEDMAMEVHVKFRDEPPGPHPFADVVVYVEKGNHSLSEVKSLAIQQALDFLSRVVTSTAKAHGA